MDVLDLTCPACGAQCVVATNRILCEYCGRESLLKAEEEEAAANTMTIPVAGLTKACPMCHGKVPESATKCRHCGEWLDGRPREAAAPAPTRPAKEIVTELVDAHFKNKRGKKLNHWNSSSYKAISGSSSSYLSMQPGETALVLLDDTTWGSGKGGLTVTDQRVVWNLPSGRGEVFWRELRSVTASGSTINLDHRPLSFQHTPGQELASLIRFLQEAVSLIHGGAPPPAPVHVAAAGPTVGRASINPAGFISVRNLVVAGALFVGGCCFLSIMAAGLSEVDSAPTVNQPSHSGAANNPLASPADLEREGTQQLREAQKLRAGGDLEGAEQAAQRAERAYGKLVAKDRSLKNLGLHKASLMLLNALQAEVVELLRSRGQTTANSGDFRGAVKVLQEALKKHHSMRKRGAGVGEPATIRADLLKVQVQHASVQLRELSMLASQGRWREGDRKAAEIRKQIKAIEQLGGRAYTMGLENALRKIMSKKRGRRRGRRGRRRGEFGGGE